MPLETSNCGNNCKFQGQCSTWREYDFCAGKGIGRNSCWQGQEFIFCARTDSIRAAACLLGNNPHGMRKNLVLDRMEICFNG